MLTARSVLSLLLLTNVAAATSICSDPSPSTSSQDIKTFLNGQYDYVIIGGGTAGVALGTRLATNPNINIAILEAGVFHKDDPLVDIPGLNGQAIGNSLYDWNFVSVPQTNAGGRAIALPRGKMLGGSSALNGLAWNRASAIEYDAWQQFGGKSWSWLSLLPFFKKSESLALPDNDPYSGISKAASEAAEVDIPKFDGTSGPISASHNSFYFEVVQTFVKTLNAIGVRTNAEPSAGNATGVYNTHAAIDRKHGVRSYAATSYFCQAGAPRNVHILLGAQVQKIDFKNTASGLLATNVKFTVNGQNYTVNALQEVILAAGAVQTPQILELSGIGNSTLLKSFGIEPLINLPAVGENLQEHLFASAQWRLKPGHATFDLLRNNATFSTEEMERYNSTKTGIFTDLDSTLAFVPSNAITNGDGVKDLISALDADMQNPGLFPFQVQQLKTQRSWLVDQKVAQYEIIQLSRGIIAPAANESYVAAIGGVSHPTSRGNVHIVSVDPLAPPVIDPKFLSTKFDQLSQLELLKFVQSIGKQSPLAEIIDVQTNPDPTAQSDDDLLNWIKATSVGGDHLIGTAVMAPQSLGGVVSSELKVYGTRNLRVVDASIFPLHIAAHTQSTVYAIAEMGAEMILGIH